MKKSIIITAFMFASFFTQAQTIKIETVKIVCYVQAGKERKPLTNEDVKYILSVRDSLKPVFTSGIQTIRNSAEADIILAILKAKK